MVQRDLQVPVDWFTCADVVAPPVKVRQSLMIKARRNPPSA
jgi:hypothetical protein